MAEVKVTVQEDPNLGSGPDEDASELSVSENDSDSGSVLSDDSVLPKYEREDASGGPANTLYQACAKNNAAALRRVLERGVSRDEVMELDINGRVGSEITLLLIKHHPHNRNLIAYIILYSDKSSSCSLIERSDVGRLKRLCGYCVWTQPVPISGYQSSG